MKKNTLGRKGKLSAKKNGDRIKTTKSSDLGCICTLERSSGREKKKPC